MDNYQEILRRAVALAYPRPGDNLEALAEDYREHVAALRDEQLSEAANEYQTTLDSLSAAFDYMNDLDAVISDVRKSREADEKSNGELADKVVENVVQAFSLSEEDDRDIRRFLQRFSGGGRLWVATAIRLAYVKDNDFVTRKTIEWEDSFIKVNSDDDA